MWKKHKLVMLPTEKAKIYVSRITGQLGLYKEEKTYTGESQGRHLYILSEDKINDDNWFVKMNYKGGKPTLYQECKKAFCNSEWLNSSDVKDVFKVIATTDKSLLIEKRDDTFKMAYGLPQIPQSFIEQFISSYNEGKIISEVMVEYDEEELYTRNIPRAGLKPENRDMWVSLKTNPDNTINIKLIKDNFSRDEVIELLKKFNDRFGTLGLVGDFKSQDEPKFDKWIEQNL